MGLNVNYHLLTEGANSRFAIPEYRPIETLHTYSEAYLLGVLSDFNQEIRESKTILNSIYGDDSEVSVYIESGLFTNIINIIKTVIDKVITALRNIMNAIINFFKQIIAAAKNAIHSKPDAVEIKYKPYEINKVLADALAQADPVEKTISISNIRPTEDLLNKDFPATSVIGSSLIDSTVTSMDLYVFDYNRASGRRDYEVDAVAAESLATRLHDQENEIAQKILGKYYVDNAFTNLPEVIESAAIKAFGSTATSPTTLTVDLYNLAKDNLTRSKDIMTSIQKSIDDVQRNYNELNKKLADIKNRVLRMEKSIPNYSVDMQKSFNDAARRVVRSVNDILGIVQKAANADYQLLAKKGRRINQIFDYVPTSTTGDSMRVKTTCHNLILKYVEKNPQVESAINGLEASVESARMQEEFDSAIAMIDEAYLENEYNSLVETIIMEATNKTGAAKPTTAPAGSTTQASQTATQQSTTTNNTASETKQQTTQSSTANNQQQQQNKNTTQKSTSGGNKSTIGRTIDAIVDKVVEMFQKFKNRITELVTQQGDGTFWNNNRQRLSNASFVKTEVNDWHVYNLDLFQKDLCEETVFDINARYLDSDEAMQNMIIERILSGTRPVDSVNAKDSKDNSFSKKIARAYESNYIHYDNDQMIQLGSGNIFDAKKAFEFVDDFVRNGFNGKSLGSIKKDGENLKKLKDAVKNDHSLADKYQDNYMNNTTEKVANADNAKIEPVAQAGGNNTANAASAKPVGGESAFNLADHFALYNPQPIMDMIHEAEVKINADESLNTTNTDKGAHKDATRIADERIQRYFRYMSFAITAKMTTALAAYKQYMGLYKSAYKQTSKKETNKK